MISFDLTSALSLLSKNLSFLTSALSLLSKNLSFLTSAFSLTPFFLESFNLFFSFQSKPLKTTILAVLA
ncbi:MAG: hypothetical protein MJE63_33675, partial [Proteobacteria bacterium]|nr:hypothetical protein [Pseudomonadota bacterium]